jgi:hypothetical protein
MRKPLRRLLVLALLAAALPAQAIDDDRFVLRASAFNGDGRADVEGRTTYLGTPETYAERFDTGSTTVPAVEAQLRLGERHRLVFNHISFDEDQDATLDEPISFDTVTIPAGSTARGEAELRLTGLAYDFAVVESQTFSAGLQLGVQNARVSGRLRAVSGANAYDESDSEDGTLPVLGARLTFAPNASWRVEAQAQHVDAGWLGADDYEGSLTMAHALAEYRFGGRFGLHAGYKSVRVDLRDPEQDEGVTGFDLRFDGPVVGLTVAF